ncbi:MAG: hypothetical protein ACPHN2_10820 [Sinimarinibacterium flocculans]|nr:hypothetical protein [Sinimarinibacterium flocculans]MEC9363232.1 hypothetical protein [Pseudomonadota bacterium]
MRRAIRPETTVAAASADQQGNCEMCRIDNNETMPDIPLRTAPQAPIQVGHVRR